MSELIQSSLIYTLATLGLLAAICCALYLLMHILVALTFLVKERVECLFDWCDVLKLMREEQAAGRLKWRSKERKQ